MSRPCVVCGRQAVAEFLDLGRTALANKFLTREELASATEERYPLRIGFCRTCAHVQLTELVPPSAMFEDYLYVSAASRTLREHFEDLSAVLVERHALSDRDLVMDIGCNDATLLAAFKRRGVRTLGIDPARNLAELTHDLGIDRYTGFFTANTAAEIVERWGRAALVTATNTFPHIPDLHDFVEGIRTVLAPGGSFVIEVHYLLDLVGQLAFDTIYHEHVSYWGLGPMNHLFEMHGLRVVDAERLPLHHGQLRATVRREEEGEPSPGVATILEREREAGLDRYETFERFAARTAQLKIDLNRLLADLRSGGKRIAAYGAPAKGNTLLEFLELGPGQIEYIVDRSALKQGRFAPGSHIPVVAPERLLLERPDYVLLLAWNFADEILEQQAKYRAGGGKFIIPVPQVAII